MPGPLSATTAGSPSRCLMRGDTLAQVKDPSLPIRVSDQVSESEWDAYVQSHVDGTVDHAWGWRTVFRDVFGHQSCYLAARRGDRIVGVLPLVTFKSMLFGRFLTSMPFLNYGGVLADDEEAIDALITMAREVATQHRAAHIELRHVSRQLPNLPVRQHKLKLTREIGGSADELWNRLDKKVRNLVRKGEREGLTTQVGGRELVEEFYQVFSRNMRDLGTPVYPMSLFTRTLEVFPSRARVYVVRLGNIPVGASLTLRHGSTVLVPWASSLREYRQHAPNMLLYWTMLKGAVADDARVFDFGRSSPDSGTHHFKRQWGAVETPLHWEYVLLTSTVAPDQGPGNPRFRAMVELWKKIPVPIANKLGPVIIRHIP